METEKCIVKVLDEASSEPASRMSFDQLLLSLGEFGTYQKVLFFVLWLPAAASAVGIYVSIFLEYTPKHWCALPDACAALPDPSWLVTGVSDRSCFIANVTTDTCDQPHAATDNPHSEVACPNGYEFDQGLFTSTAVTEFQIVCDEGWMKQASSVSFMSGMLVGSFFFGWISDLLGRRVAFGSSALFLCSGSFLVALAPAYPVLIAGRFIGSMGGIGLFIIAFVLSMEFIGPKRRTLCGVAIEIPFALGELYLVALAYFIREWRWLQAAIAVPFLGFFVMLLWLPESVRWAITKGKTGTALRTLHRLGKINQSRAHPATEEQIQGLFKDGDTNLGLSSLITSSSLRPRLLIMAINWVVATLSYYGLGLAASLSDNLFITFSLSAVMEIVAYLVTLATLDKFGRKPILVGSQCLAAVSCILAGCLPSQLPAIILALTVLGKFGASAAFAIVFLYTAELFPTPMRNTAVGLCSTCARMGGIASPLVTALGKSVAPQAPFLVIGISSLLGGLTAFGLPETKGRPLPDTLEEALQKHHFTSDEIEDKQLSQ